MRVSTAHEDALKRKQTYRRDYGGRGTFQSWGEDSSEDDEDNSPLRSLFIQPSGL